MYRVQLIYHKIFLENNPNLNWDRIPDGSCIHHIDFNHNNNDYTNLRLMTKSDHMKLHQTSKILSKETIEKHKKQIPWNKGLKKI